jgi:hypothetical protein
VEEGSATKDSAEQSQVSLYEEITLDEDLVIASAQEILFEEITISHEIAPLVVVLETVSNHGKKEPRLQAASYTQ